MAKEIALTYKYLTGAGPFNRPRINRKENAIYFLDEGGQTTHYRKQDSFYHRQAFYVYLFG